MSGSHGVTPEFTDREVEQAHTIADLTTDLAACRRRMDSAASLLAQAMEALADSRVDIATEFVDRALTAVDRSHGVTQ